MLCRTISPDPDVWLISRLLSLFDWERLHRQSPTYRVVGGLYLSEIRLVLSDRVLMTPHYPVGSGCCPLLVKTPLVGPPVWWGDNNKNRVLLILSTWASPSTSHSNCHKDKGNWKATLHMLSNLNRKKFPCSGQSDFSTVWPLQEIPVGHRTIMCIHRCTIAMQTNPLETSLDCTGGDRLA